MNVNAAGKRISIFGFQAFKPDDSCNDRVTARGVWSKDFARRPSIFKDRPHGRTRPNLLCHLHSSERGFPAAGPISQPES